MHRSQRGVPIFLPTYLPDCPRSATLFIADVPFDLDHRLSIGHLITLNTEPHQVGDVQVVFGNNVPVLG